MTVSPTRRIWWCYLDRLGVSGRALLRTPPRFCVSRRLADVHVLVRILSWNRCSLTGLIHSLCHKLHIPTIDISRSGLCDSEFVFPSPFRSWLRHCYETVPLFEMPPAISPEGTLVFAANDHRFGTASFRVTLKVAWVLFGSFLIRRAWPPSPQDDGLARPSYDQNDVVNTNQITDGNYIRLYPGKLCVFVTNWWKGWSMAQMTGLDTSAASYFSITIRHVSQPPVISIFPLALDSEKSSNINTATVILHGNAGLQKAAFANITSGLEIEPTDQTLSFRYYLAFFFGII